MRLQELNGECVAERQHQLPQEKSASDENMQDISHVEVTELSLPEALLPAHREREQESEEEKKEISIPEEPTRKPPERAADNEIADKPRRCSRASLNASGNWVKVKSKLGMIRSYGYRQGILSKPDEVAEPATTEADTMFKKKEDEVPENEQLNLPVDVNESLIYAAIPFVPVPVAIVCLLLNVVLPGSGTIFGGLTAACVGQPRLNVKEARMMLTVLINFGVGVSQLVTVTFLLVGWFWSISWGALLITHSLEYRKALLEKRKEAITSVALKAIHKDVIIRKKDVRAMLSELEPVEERKKKRKKSITVKSENKD